MTKKKHECPWCLERKVMGPCPAHTPRPDRSRGLRSWVLWRSTEFAQALICMYSEGSGRSLWYVAFVDRESKPNYAQLTRHAARQIWDRLLAHGAVLVDVDPTARADTKVWN